MPKRKTALPPTPRIAVANNRIPWDFDPRTILRFGEDLPGFSTVDVERALDDETVAGITCGAVAYPDCIEFHICCPIQPGDSIRWPGGTAVRVAHVVCDEQAVPPCRIVQLDGELGSEVTRSSRLGRAVRYRPKIRRVEGRPPDGAHLRVDRGVYHHAGVLLDQEVFEVNRPRRLLSRFQYRQVPLRRDALQTEGFAPLDQQLFVVDYGEKGDLLGGRSARAASLLVAQDNFNMRRSSRVQARPRYRPLLNNCQDVAAWVVTGEGVSEQALRVGWWTGIVGAALVLVGSIGIVVAPGAAVAWLVLAMGAVGLIPAVVTWARHFLEPHHRRRNSLITGFNRLPRPARGSPLQRARGARERVPVTGPVLVEP